MIVKRGSAAEARRRRKGHAVERGIDVRERAAEGHSRVRRAVTAPVPLPSLKLKLKPVVPLSVSVPLVAVSVTWMLFVPASGSATEI